MWFNKTPVRYEEIEEGLNNLVYVLSETISSLNQVRVFGSYNNGNWKLEKSDVDIFVKVDDEYYSYLKHRIKNSHSDFPIFLESEQRGRLRKRIMEEFPKETRGFMARFHPHILSNYDLKKMWNLDELGRGPIGKNMARGKLLYPSHGFFGRLFNG